MKVAIMQPYLFPYIGYFQLINSVDLFVICDEVSYIRYGWINRNRILLSDKEYTFTLSLQNSRKNKIIKELYIYNPESSKEKLLSTLRHAYTKAPQFKTVFPILEEIILYKENNLSKYIANSIKRIANELNIKTKIIFSGNIDNNKELKKQDRVIDMCEVLNATEYINPHGGISLYDKETFKNHNIDLFFLKPRNIEYKQFNSKFAPCLSIIDVMMFNSNNKIKEFLNEYDLL